MSIVFDNRSRISVRVAQLKTGRRYTQEPKSSLVSVLSNIQILNFNGDEMDVASNMTVHEDNTRGGTIWAARVSHKLRRVDGKLRMFFKKVSLVNNQKPVLTLSFLI